MLGLPIIIPTRQVGSLAALALTMEGLEVNEIVMRDYTHYGRSLTQQWHSRQGFILVEEDIVPWPGALAELDACGHDWCAFEAPNGMVNWDTHSGFSASLGCVKFSTALVERYLPVGWDNTGWDCLDGKVFEILQEEEQHVHQPMVAHVKGDQLTFRRSILPVKAA